MIISLQCLFYCCVPQFAYCYSPRTYSNRGFDFHFYLSFYLFPRTALVSSKPCIPFKVQTCKILKGNAVAVHMILEPTTIATSRWHHPTYSSPATLIQLLTIYLFYFSHLEAFEDTLNPHLLSIYLQNLLHRVVNHPLCEHLWAMAMVANSPQSLHARPLRT